jgi:hypothetical protein
MQVADGTAKLEIEFAGGRKAETDVVLAWSCGAGLVELAVSTADLRPLQRGDPTEVRICERLIIFDVEGARRAIGGVDISEKQSVAGYGERIQFSLPR